MMCVIKGNRLGAFRVVSVLRNSAANKVADLMVEQVVTDQWARTQYYQLVDITQSPSRW
jgi:hypothetical protein